jgi:hypothetical protein
MTRMKRMFSKKKKNYKVQFLYNPTLNDKIKKKTEKRDDLNQPELAC